MADDKTEIEKLATLLEQERLLLLDGNLEGLGKLLPEKEKLMDGLLEGEETPAQVFLPLEGKLNQNQLLLNGAMEGIRAVSERLAALRHVRTSLDTYDANGRRQQVTMQGKSQVEKHA
ncbi:MAG: flagellar biosynthesis protein FlgN [Sulfitobacter sp.]